MKQIKIWVMNPDAVYEARKMEAFAARLTQRGNILQTLDDVKDLYNKPASPSLIRSFGDMPHPTLQKFGLINIVVVGASRRFLAQVTRHQNEVKFMSASLQYSDYAEASQFCVPYSIYVLDEEKVGNAEYEKNYFEHNYIATNREAMRAYKKAREQGLDNDACGYMAPHGLRNVLLISATVYQWKHMIHQRICRRNTEETRYVFLSIWKQLHDICPEMFPAEQCGAFCQQGACKEGKMSCGKPITEKYPSELLYKDFPLIMNEEDKEDVNNNS